MKRDGPVSFMNRNFALSSILREELRHHDGCSFVHALYNECLDIMKLFWFAGMISGLDVRSNPEKSFKLLLDNAVFANRIRRTDLSSSTFFVNSETYSLYQKGVFTKGISVLVYVQYRLILRDASDVLKKAVEIYLPDVVCKKLPKTRTKRHRVSPKVAIEKKGVAICDDLNKKTIVDTKNRLMDIGHRMKTPNANEGCMYNRIITGIGIYSQYEFDHDNLVLNHQRKIYKWTSSGYNNVDPIEREYNEKNKPSLNYEKRIVVKPTYLEDINDSNDYFEDLRLKHVHGKVLGLFDNNTEFCPYSKRFYEANRKNRRTFKFPEPENVLFRLKREFLMDNDDKTLHEILMAEFHHKYDKYINENKSAVKKILKKNKTCYYRKTSFRRYERLTKEGKPEIVESDNLYEELERFCSDRETSMCHFENFVSPRTASRYRAAVTFLNMLNLATQGRIGLQRDNNGITITINH